MTDLIGWAFALFATAGTCCGVANALTNAGLRWLRRRRPRDARPPQRTGGAGRGPARGCNLPPVFDPDRTAVKVPVITREITPTERIRRVKDHAHRTARRPT